MKDSREIRIFGGCFGVLLAIAISVAGWIAWAEAANIYDAGTDETLIVLVKTSEKAGHKGAITRFYDATIAGRPIRIETGKILPAGSMHSVIVPPLSLRRHEQSGIFADYIFGQKSETKWQIFIRDLGWPVFWIGTCFEGLALSGGLLLLISARRMPLTKLSPTLIPNRKPAAPDKVI